MQQLLGCDLSHYNAIPDWSKVSFAIMKCTEGTEMFDNTYTAKLAAARQAGMVCGHYHFSDGTDFQAEADWFLKNADIKTNDLVMLDYEIGSDVQWCKNWLDYVTSKIGFKPLIYCPAGNGADWSLITDYPLAIARYGRNNGNINLDQPPAVGKWSNWTIWQYSSANNLDLDVFYGTVDQLKAYGKPAPVEAPTPSPQETPEIVPTEQGQNQPQNDPISTTQVNDAPIEENPVAGQVEALGASVGLNLTPQPVIRTEEINELEEAEKRFTPFLEKVWNAIKLFFKIN